jgi:phosphatidylglycerophosphate synthase
MLDQKARKMIDPALVRIAGWLARTGLSANNVTWTGFVLGMASALAIAFEYYWWGLFILLLSRLCDGLDGAIARITRPTDFGGFLDIVLDFAFYGAIPLAFAFADPAANAIAAAVLIFSFYVNGASFLTFAIMSEKRRIPAEKRGSKSLYFSAGLAEATETLAVFVAMCIFPAAFSVLAWIFALISLYTATSRIRLARRIFH